LGQAVEMRRGTVSGDEVADGARAGLALLHHGAASDLQHAPLASLSIVGQALAGAAVVVVDLAVRGDLVDALHGRTSRRRRIAGFATTASSAPPVVTLILPSSM